MPSLWHAPPTTPRPQADNLPAESAPERRRLVAVAHRLGEHWGQRVHVVAEDQCALRLHLDGYGTLPGA